MATVDHAKIERAVRDILEAISEDPDRKGLLDTTACVARLFAKTCSGPLTPTKSVPQAHSAASATLLLN